MEETKLDKDINVRSKTELSDEEIIKDIERSTGMPSYWKKIVLDLIHRLNGENERLTSLYDGKHGIMTSSIGDLPLTVEGLRKAVDEISRLLIVQEELQELNAKYYNEAKDLRRANAEQKAEIERLKRYEMSESEYQKYCAYKIIEPQIRGCLDRERELQKQVDELKDELDKEYELRKKYMFSCEQKDLEIKYLEINKQQAVKDEVE